MIFCKIAILILLGVDWLEDPYLGQCSFSCIMASTPCNAHQEVEQHQFTCVEYWAPLGIADALPSNRAALPTILAPSVVKYSSCFRLLHYLMSLQL